ncbi:MAG TPA: hypothetical protein VNO82_10635 [Solirubrobacteraceae bacterium]|nr:hypothetical protein [Solirubrobacteraceae bacterium]
MRRQHKVLLTLVIGIVAAVGVSATALTQGTPTNCAASFHVLHNDRIGTLQLPEGAYQLRVNGISCVRGSHLFTEFLSDWDGNLPAPWAYTANAVGDGTFARTDTGLGFQAVRTGPATPGTPGHKTDGGGSHGELDCPSVFTVEHNDRIGPLRIPRGDYVISRLGVRITCAKSSRLLARFLQHPDGRLSGGWAVLPAQAEFVKYTTRYGFRIEPAED